MATRRERLERKLEKREEWARSRANKAASLRAVDSHLREDLAFNTQPGHIPARARMIARDDKAYEHRKVASYHADKASGLQSQLDRTIFSDDPDAIEQLHKKLSTLESRRDAMKLRNREAKNLGNPKAHESWELSNLGATIRATKARIEEVSILQERAAKAEESGGALIEMRGQYATVTFPEKPGREVLSVLKAAGFRWAKGSWVGKWSDLSLEEQQDLKEWEA